MPKKIKILDVAFDVVTQEEAISRIFEKLHAHQKFYVTTPNPEMLLEARKNSVFRDVLYRAFLSIPDGIGILWASTFYEITKRDRSKITIFLKALVSLLSLAMYPKFCRKVFHSRVTGADVFIEIAKRSTEKHFKIFLLGAQEGVAAHVKEILEKTFSGIHIVGTFSGSPKNEYFSEIQKKIAETKPDILFVAFGAPSQELWIASHLHELPSLRMAMGVGGAFDFLAGIRKRAPRWMQKLGMEWLFRLFQQPSRLKRIFNATIKFPWIIITSTFGKHDRSPVQ